MGHQDRPWDKIRLLQIMLTLTILSMLTMMPAVQTIDYWLGDNAGYQLSANIRLTPVEPTGVFDVSIEFWTEKAHSKKLLAQRDLGLSAGPPRLIDCEDIVGNGRNQLFVSISHGRIATWIFDFDGARAKDLYHRTSGRVLTYLDVQADGTATVKELWPRTQFVESFPDIKISGKLALVPRSVRVSTASISGSRNR